MPTYNCVKQAQAVHAAAYGNRCVFSDAAVVGAALAAADVLNLVKIPAGTLVDRVVIKNPDLDTGTTLVFKLGFAAIDGSALPSTMATPDVAIAAAGQTTWQAAATTTYEVFPPYLVERDCFLQAVVGTGGTTNTGTIYSKVEGEALGPK